MLSTIYFLRYNNYYNRKLKRELTLSDYEDFIIGTQERHNFIPNDGVSTEMVMNTYSGEVPDYLLVVENNEIMSRWFVIDATRNCKGQFTMNLFRDTLADYFDEILNAPIFVEKAMLDASNPLIFNQEDMTFNQIRQEPILLYDRSESPWIVGYIPGDADFGASGKEIKKAVGISAADADYEVEDLETWKQNNYYYNPGFYSMKSKIRIRYKKTNISGYNRTTTNELIEMNNTYDETFKQTMGDNSAWNGTYLWEGNVSYPVIDPQTVRHAFYDNTTNVSYLDGYRNSTYNIMTSADYEYINELRGKIIKDTTTDTYYTIEVFINNFSEDKNLTSATALRSSINTAFLNSIRDNRGAVVAPTSGALTNNTYSVYTTGIQINVNLKQLFLEVKTTLTNDRFHLEDQPYDMFCIPYSDSIGFEQGYTVSFSSVQAAANIATEIAKDAGAGKVYDVQVLPYCPVNWAFIEGSNVINLSKIKHSLITDSENNPVSAVLWCKQSNFRVELPYTIDIGGSAINRKLNSQAKKYRLVSPNYGSIFEFDPEKNDGVSGFIADCSYKPINPYIRVAPVFKGLYGYGGEYDSRGLILSGDFSLPRVESAWANYQEQNKNFQSIFDRQIQNMEVQNKYQRINDYFNAITGTFSGAVGGAMTGGMMSGMHPAGFAVGAGLGATASAAGGIADIMINEKLREEAIDYTKDQFGYNLGNIQAIPTSLAKTSAITINNPFIPMLEVYTATQQEIDAFINKIIYNGMTVMTIGFMGNYINNGGYFKGKLIRLEGIDDDFHITNTIAKELDKGVFLS